MNSLFLPIKASILCLFSLIVISFHGNAAALSSQSNFTLNQLYHILHNSLQADMSTRLNMISANFLDKPYLLGALGEGPEASYDQSPLYRTDKFDCVTYVDTVIALALADNLQIFQQCINKIRYQDGQVGFLTRNHFTALDWNKNNQKQGFLKDITTSFKDENNQLIAETATALVDKPAWYQHLPISVIKLISSNKQEQEKRWLELKHQGSKLPKAIEEITYLPLTKLFDQQGNPNNYLFAQIPNASIIEIVRPNWDLRQQIGTRLNVSHLGFAFWKNGLLLFRQASSRSNKVVDEPLIDYLKQARLSPTIKGINVQVLIPQKPFSDLSYPCKIRKK